MGVEALRSLAMATFPEELVRLARSLGTDTDGAVALLAHWFYGCCLDGTIRVSTPTPCLWR
jgi:hypothetical protein